MTTQNAHARRRWAYRMMARCEQPPPPYGSAEWLELPEGSAAKVAAVIRAAECWATDGDNLEANLRAEIDTAAKVAKRLDDDDYVARRDAWREEWGNRDFRPHPANLRGPLRRVCLTCGTPTSPWACSCGETRSELAGGAA